MMISYRTGVLITEIGRACLGFQIGGWATAAETVQREKKEKLSILCFALLSGGVWGYNPVWDDRSDFTQSRPL